MNSLCPFRSCPSCFSARTLRSFLLCRRIEWKRRHRCPHLASCPSLWWSHKEYLSIERMNAKSIKISTLGELKAFAYIVSSWSRQSDTSRSRSSCPLRSRLASDEQRTCIACLWMARRLPRSPRTSPKQCLFHCVQFVFSQSNRNVNS